MLTKRCLSLTAAATLLVIAVLACNAPAEPTATPTPATPLAEVTATPATPPPDVTATVTPPTTTTTTPAPDVTTAAGCTLNSGYVADVTAPDNTPFSPGTGFTKTWRIRNSGTCNWEAGTTLVFISGAQMSGPASVPVGAVVAGATTDVSVSLVAPATPGTYKGNWQLQAPDGVRFGQGFYVQIVVPAPVTPTLAATATPTLPPGLAIITFTVSAVDMAGGAKKLTFNWQTTGATRVMIWSGTQQRFPQAWDVAINGTLTVDLAYTYYSNPSMTMIAYDAADNSVSKSVTVTWACTHAYFFTTSLTLCPASAPSETWAAQQPFEHGRMLWLEEVSVDASTTYSGVIMVLFADGRYAQYQDTWVEGEAESDPSLVPPAGMLQPIRGFGKVWRTTTSVRDGLGWATAAEQGFDTTWQLRVSESLPSVAFVRTLEGQVLEIDGWGWATGGTWKVAP